MWLLDSHAMLSLCRSLCRKYPTNSAYNINPIIIAITFIWFRDKDSNPDSERQKLASCR